MSIVEGTKMRVSLLETDTGVRGMPWKLCMACSALWDVWPAVAGHASPMLPKQSCKSALRDRFEAAPYYQRRLNLYDEREHLERYPVDSYRCLPKEC